MLPNNFLAQVEQIWLIKFMKFYSEWGSKKILGGFWHLSQVKFEEISPKIPRMQILRKLSPLLVPRLLSPPVPPGGQKFLGGFWHLSQLKFEEISPKIPNFSTKTKTFQNVNIPPPLVLLSSSFYWVSILTMWSAFMNQVNQGTV